MPAHIKVIKTILPTYTRRHCERNGSELNPQAICGYITVEQMYSAVTP
ncbi:hypothetical protein [Moritella sp. 24]|nr:hypothetical protein [Moritella sp. 24]